MYIYTPLCRYWITLYRYVLVFIVPHVDIEQEDNKQFISNIPRKQLTFSDAVFLGALRVKYTDRQAWTNSDQS